MILQKSPNSRARLTGVVYLLYFLAAITAQLFFRDRVVLFITINLIAYAFYMILALLFYYLFKPVNGSLSLVAALFGLCGCIVGILELFQITLNYLGPLTFFGPYCILIGWLIFRSTFLPHILGLLMMLAGISWLAFLTPVGKKYLTSYIEVIGVLAEVSLMLWLIIKGVNPEGWNEQAKKQ
jgi:hypothetical protein